MAEATRSLEVLERSLAYTRMALAGVRDSDLTRPTPCRRWDLNDLLAHMDDALDAFTEGAHGTVDVSPVGFGLDHRVATLQRKACALLGAWTASTPPDPVPPLVGGHRIDRILLARAAALEIAAHGWDVGVATGRGSDLPEALARELLPAAWLLVGETDRTDAPNGTHRFARVLPTDARASYGEQFLAYVGRRRH